MLENVLTHPTSRLTAVDILVLSWGLLKTGGTIVLDDYLWDGSCFAGKGDRLPGELLPRMAIRSFMRSYRNYIEPIYLGEQVVSRKRENPCLNKSHCSPIGEYTYDWQEKKLARQSDRKTVELSPRLGVDF